MQIVGFPMGRLISELTVYTQYLVLQYMKEVTRLVSGETRHKLGKGLVLFAKDWMKFVSEKCEMGRGMRPRYNLCLNTLEPESKKTCLQDI